MALETFGALVVAQRHAERFAPVALRRRDRLFWRCAAGVRRFALGFRSCSKLSGLFAGVLRRSRAYREVDGPARGGVGGGADGSASRGVVAP